MGSEVGMEVRMGGSNGDCSGGWPGLRFLQEAGRQSDIRLCGGWRVPARERGAAGKEKFRQRASGQAKIDFEGKQYAPYWKPLVIVLVSLAFVCLPHTNQNAAERCLRKSIPFPSLRLEQLSIEDR